MLSFNPFFLPVVLLLMLGSLSLTTHAADPFPLYHFCANNTFSQNSLYNSSLNSLLSSLSSNVSCNIEFYNTTSGQNTSDPVYGFFLCRGDVTSQMCRTCVAVATKELAAKCSREKVVVIWYDECMIRYSNDINRLPICCGGKQGGRALFPSRNVRYELYPFYTGASTPPPPAPGPASPPPPTGSAAGSKGKVEADRTEELQSITLMGRTASPAGSGRWFSLGDGFRRTISKPNVVKTCFDLCTF